MSRKKLTEAHVANGKEEAGDKGLLEIPARCPVSGGELHISELTCEESGVVIRGKFRIPEQAALDEEKQNFLKVFLKARGVISTVEKEMGISYPTVRARLDSLLQDMGLAPTQEDADRRKKIDEKKKQVLKDLEDGKLTAEQAKKKLKALR
jgi:hypothetical protein